MAPAAQLIVRHEALRSSVCAPFVLGIGAASVDICDVVWRMSIIHRPTIVRLQASCVERADAYHCVTQ